VKCGRAGKRPRVRASESSEKVAYVFLSHDGSCGCCVRLAEGAQVVTSGRERNKLGQRGEKLAQKYLKKSGYRILQSNYTVEQGEVDLIMRDDETVVFVEVKTRKSEELVQGEETVNYHKQKHIAAVARQFIHAHNLYDFPCRFDVVVVIVPERGKPNIRHWKNVFLPPRY